MLFAHETPGLKAGICISVVSAAGLAGYAAVSLIARKRKEEKNG